MKIIALTGSIGMGKSTTAAMFADSGVPVWDADAAVHSLYGAAGAAVDPLKTAFGDVCDEDGGIDRQKLADAVVGKPEKLARLEAIVHPLVAADRKSWLAERKSEGRDFVLVDVPLLYETGGDRFVDVVVLASCDAALQRQRVLERPGMTVEKFEAILARQMPDLRKRARADFIIETGLGLDHAREQVTAVLSALNSTEAKDHA
jgi:dephospho-CoA kinase